MVFFNRCCCRSIENHVDRRSERRAPSSLGESKSNSISGGESDDDSDIQAVQWMRNRSKRNSNDAMEDVQEMWIEKENQAGESLEHKKQAPERKEAPSSAVRTSQLESSLTRRPMDTDGNMDVEMIADETSPIEKKMDSQVITDPTLDDKESDDDSASDGDSETKARYFRAVNLLHKTMLEKEVSLTTTERDFLSHLLGSFEEEERSYRVWAIENAAQALEEKEICQAPAPPSPFQTLQNISPSTRPTFQGVGLAVVSPVGRSASGEGFELLTPESISINDDDMDMAMGNQDDPPVSINEDQKYVKSHLVHCFPSHDNWDDDDDDDSALPFYILGQSFAGRPYVLTPLLLEALRGFLPYVVSEENFWLKFSLLRDGASLATLLHMVRASKWTIIGIETMDGDVFGSFTATSWRKQKGFYGSGEAFLWRLKQSRTASSKVPGTSSNHEMEVYPYTGVDDLVQHCSDASLVVGGGDWIDQECPHKGEPKGVGLMVDRDLAMGETNSCATFANPRLCRRTKSSNDFHVSNMEVWTTTPYTTLEEAQKLEAHKLFVGEQQRVVSVQ